jgi:hypothetical protein
VAEPADITGAIKQNEVVECVLLQPDRGPDATEAGADDRNVIAGDGGHGHALSTVLGRTESRSGQADACSQER